VFELGLLWNVAVRINWKILWLFFQCKQRGSTWNETVNGCVIEYMCSNQKLDDGCYKVTTTDDPRPRCKNENEFADECADDQITVPTYSSDPCCMNYTCSKYCKVVHNADCLFGDRLMLYKVTFQITRGVPNAEIRTGFITWWCASASNYVWVPGEMKMLSCWA